LARYKYTEKEQRRLLAVNLSKQLVEGTFEYTLNSLIDEKLDLSVFDKKYKNDLTGAIAINPRIMLKIILYCCSLGIISSRKIARMCETNIVVKALAEDTGPHYTTISDLYPKWGRTGLLCAARKSKRTMAIILYCAQHRQMHHGKKEKNVGMRLKYR